MSEKDTRVEVAARALARHRLTSNELWPKQSGLGQEILDAAVERLWPQLADEARAVVEALER